MRAHLAMAAGDRVARGESPAEAERAARREFGNLSLIAETTRDNWGTRWILRLGQDLRYGLRALRHAPAFTAITVFTLALGIGAATTIYSVTDALILHPLPFPNSGRLVYAHLYSARYCPRCYELPLAYLAPLREGTRRGIDWAVSRSWSPVLRGAQRTRVLPGAVVSPDFFQVLRAQPELGRLFTPADTGANADAIVLSDAAWRAEFAADPQILGRSLVLDGVLHPVIGVLRPADVFPPSARIWQAMAFDRAAAARLMGSADVFGRLHREVSLAAAQAAVATVDVQLRRSMPQSMRNWQLDLQPMRRWHEDTRPALLVLMVAVGLILLVAYLNLAGLLFARLAGRRRELAVRAAVGASGGRLVRQLLTETLLVAMAGAAVGTALSLWAVRVIHGSVPVTLASFEPGWSRMHVNARAIAFTVTAAVATGLLVGTGPAFRFSRVDLLTDLKDSARTSNRSIGGGRIRGALVVAQLALALVLVSAAGLLVRTIANMNRADVGIRPDHVLTMAFQRDMQSSDSIGGGYFDRLACEVEALPGAVRAGAVSALPLSHHSETDGFSIVGQPDSALGDGRPMARLQLVTNDYFATMGIPRISGRLFTAADARDTGGVAVINHSLARKYFAGRNPIDHLIAFGRRRYRIVGIVGDVSHDGVNDEPGTELYLLTRDLPARATDFAVRTRGDPALTAPAILRAIHHHDPDLAVDRVQTMNDLVAEFMSPYRLLLGLMVGFALIALLTSVIGLYGVVSYAASERTREFGIRLALGATRSDVRSLVIGQGLRLAVLGAVLGLAGALGATRLMTFLLYNVQPDDLATLVGVAGLLAAVAVGAAYLPARRAMRIDPMCSLREE